MIKPPSSWKPLSKVRVINDSTHLSSHIRPLVTNRLLVPPDPASDSQPQIPSTPNCKPPQAEINYNDGSDALFSLFNEKTMEFDSKHIENWREDANSLMILVSHRLPFIKHIGFN